MMIPLSQTPEGEPIRAQVAVVGSGPAGAEVAGRLAVLGRRVVVIESGREAYDPAIQALNDVEFVGKPHRAQGGEGEFHEYLPPELRGVSRLRGLGGTSAVWTGKWRMFEPRDLAGRAWAPHSRWPIGYATLLAAYREVARDHGLALGPDHPDDPDFAARRRALESAGFRTVPFFQHARPWRAAGGLVEAAARGALSVLLDATAVRVELADGADRMTAVVCRSIGGAERRVEAEHLVLAAGGLETPRLLLASDTQRPAGLGNGHDLVGRFYQDHPKINRARFAPGPLMDLAAPLFRTGGGARRMVSVGLSDAAQERLGVLEATLFLRPRYESPQARLLNRLLGRPMTRDGFGAARAYSAKFAVEQAPDPRSRVRLSSERDALGVPRLVVDWRLGDLDRRSFEAGARELAALARASGLGTLDLRVDAPDLDAAMDSAHHIGTTRMGATPREGVVDSDCALFEAPNVHVAGSAVFPTGAAYSPTLTIVALARRLANRLDAELARPVAALTRPS